MHGDILLYFVSLKIDRQGLIFLWIVFRPAGSASPPPPVQRWGGGGFCCWQAAGLNQPGLVRLANQADLIYERR